ncbi:ABC transporter permease [Lentzea sp. BCCO 10_0798]|uniref:ABC transporter permease n=1 Tax=Lentzea kristufekii TaxID=3095430 RepID=A0ABU4TRI8_9PSEU|nr:ABC transporter permease [Lentzea sp. BCCO 10_0798]MDX8050903.1 ABC transporter permease [Lentzea sp. BCCO 10_0798]
MIRVFLSAAWFQLLMLRGPADLAALFNTPLFTLALLAIMQHAGRADLAPYAVVGSTVIAVWSMAMLVSGDIIDSDRANGTLEAVIGTPAPLTVVVLGRTATVTVVSMVALLESVAVAWLAFDVVVAPEHVGVLLATLAVTVVAMVGTATAMAGVFVLARSARTFQNALSYPFYLLSGAVVPTDLLPAWLQPVSRVVFLSWSTDLVRDSLRAAPVPDVAARLAVVLALGLLGYLGGTWMLATVLRRVRTTGAVGFA